MNQTIFRERRALPFLALAAELAWGSAYPLIKLGLVQFGIGTGDLGGKTLFAGIRFLLAGLAVLAIAWRGGRSLRIRKELTGLLLLFALVNTTLHYFFFYVGLSNSYGARASVLDSLGTFILVFLACAVFAEEHITARKVLGCVLGFTGLLVLNLGGGEAGHFTLSGDGMMVLNSICAACGGVLTRCICRRMDALSATGYGLAAGGLFLILGGVFLEGRIPKVSAWGIGILFLLVCVSAVGFSIYNQLLTYHPVGQVAIYNSLIPVFGVALSCIVLGEPFAFQYVISGVLVASGVWIVNRPGQE